MPYRKSLLFIATMVITTTIQASENARATFGGGCFWCMEPPYDKLEGVLQTVSGYAGGDVEDPTYEQVTAGGTGHVEVVQVTYNPEKITYEELLDVYWPETDPTDAGGQFCDRGESYRPVIFYHDGQQKQLAEASKANLAESKPFDEPIMTTIEPLEDSFYPAEDYHQNYYEKNPIRYKFYRYNCGRDKRLEQLWANEG